MGGNPNYRAGTKEALRNNIEAIKQLKRIEARGEAATPDERAVLTRYTGFGALASTAFPDLDGKFRHGWEELGRELRTVLTDEEYASARATTFSAFYTSGIVMREMFRGLRRMGIATDARGLEPGCGIGNFIAEAPDGVQLVGVEKDTLSGRIAAHCYPEHDIRVEDFSDTQLPEGSVDFAIGNVPFAEIKIRYRGQRHSLHDFFVLKALDAVRPGGAVAMVTSRYTLDKASAHVRELLAQQADFAGAVRLPGEAFRNQGTSVVTDILFLRKKPLAVELTAPEWADDAWLHADETALDGGAVTLNRYFQRHPELVLGRMAVGSGMYHASDLRVQAGEDYAAALGAAIDTLPAGICTTRTTPLPDLRSAASDPNLPPDANEGSLFVAEDRTICQVTAGKAEPVGQAGKPLRADGTPAGKRLAGLIALKSHARHVLSTQKDGADEAERNAARQRLLAAYRQFVRKYGPINKTTISVRKDGGITRRMPNLFRFGSDPDRFLVMALERYDERTNTAEPAAIMERDVVSQAAELDSVDSAKDGLLASLNQHGCVDLPTIAALYGRGEAEVVEELGTLIYFDPAQDAWVPADEYLSGNVREKLRLAEATTDPRTARNARALREVLPEDLVAEEIDATLGTPWIPAKDVERFCIETLGVPERRLRVEYVNKEALWKVRIPGYLRTSAAATSEYGTEDADAFGLIEQALNMRSPTVRRKVPGGKDGSDTWVVDQEATLAAREKQAALKQRFSEWVFSDPARSDRLVRFYNKHFNNIRLRSYDGSHLSFPSMSRAIAMRPHQRDAIWRVMSSGNALLAHVVGAGKTFTMVAAGMEMKRTGLARKPLYVVPNHMLEQFSREFLTLYPDASILVASKDDLRKDRRQLLKAQVATGEWDGIVMTHSSFEKIAMSPGFQAQFLSEQLREYEALLSTVSDRSLTRTLTKRIEKLKAGREARLKEMLEDGAKDAGLYFDELGVDHLFIDEAHMFKNLETPTKMDRVAGIQTGGSKRSFDLLMKSRFLQARTPGRGLTFATGTPVSNSLGEMYTMMRYLAPELLRERGIEHFDAWAAAFGEVINALEISPDGQSLRVNSRFAKFKNLPELLSLFRLFADVQTTDMLDLPVPALKGGKAEIVASELTEVGFSLQEGLVKRYERVRGGHVDPRVDNALKIITDGRKLALDVRLLDPDGEDAADAKVNRLVENVFAIWERTEATRATQMIFCDLGVNETVWGFSVYDEVIRMLEELGVPTDEIASIGDAGTDQKKESLFANVRSGRVRILLGSTTKMGTGTNVQSRLCALHHLDPPWRPADIEQREGRILRQGNTNREVEIYRYVTEGSFDAFMWQTLETKARFIAQAMQGDAGTRRADDIGGAELSFAEVKAIASGNPAMLVLAEMEMEVRQLSLLRKAHYRDQAKIAAKIGTLPGEIERLRERIDELEADTARRQETKGDAFAMTVQGRTYRREKGEQQTARQRAQEALSLAVAEVCGGSAVLTQPRKIGELGGLNVVVSPHMDGFTDSVKTAVYLQGVGEYRIATLNNPKRCPELIQGMEQTLRSLDARLARDRASCDQQTAELERYRNRQGAAFGHEDEYRTLHPLCDRLRQLLTSKEAESDVAALDEITAIIDRFRSLERETPEPQPQRPEDVALPSEPSPTSEPEWAASVVEEPGTEPVEPVRDVPPAVKVTEEPARDPVRPAQAQPSQKRRTNGAEPSHPQEQMGLFDRPAHRPTSQVQEATSARRRQPAERPSKRETSEGRFTAMIGQQMRLPTGPHHEGRT